MKKESLNLRKFLESETSIKNMKDKEIENLIKKEEKRQRSVINLIASENYASADVKAALPSVFTDKYAEGYPGARYYGGNRVVDEVEKLAQERALKLFGLKEDEWAVNVQPYSGSPANFAVYAALLSAGEGIMGMELSSGGHLTHGHAVSLTGKFWKQIPYGVSKETELLDYGTIRKIAEKEKPKIIVVGYTAYSRIIDFKKFREIADSTGAILMVDMSHFAGLVAGGAYPSPFQYADIVTSTTHKTLRGPRGAMIFSKMDERELDKKIDKAIFPGLQGGPHTNVIAAMAVAFKEAMEPEFKKYAEQIVKNAKALSQELSKLGFRIISGGTDSHLFLVDVWKNGNGMGGKEASERLEEEGIVVNKNTIPFDERKPADPSGIRLGTAAETTRGKTEKDMIEIAGKISRILKK